MPCKNLPDDVWKFILKLLPVRERLSVCATVSKTLHRAAVAATDHVEVTVGRYRSNQTECFWGWLDRYGQHVTSLVASGAGSHTLSRLPCQNLRQLQLSACQVQLGPSSSQPGVLQVCTALTQLKLSHCSLAGGRFSLTVLSAMPALQDLQLLGLRHDHSEVPQDTCFDLPSADLRYLQQLTSVEVVNETSPVCIEHISCLKGLQRLSITCYQSSSTISGLDQLTALQDLELSSVVLDQSALPSSKLQKLSLRDCSLPAGFWQQGVFRPGQQLPELRSFQVEFGAVFGGQDVAALVSCCPALRVVNFPIESGVQLTVLAQLTALEDLIVTKADATTVSSLSALSDLRNLYRLTITGVDPDTSSLLPLTSLTRLASLYVDLRDGRKKLELELFNTCFAARGVVHKVVKVWRQLLEHCQAEQEGKYSLVEEEEYSSEGW